MQRHEPQPISYYIQKLTENESNVNHITVKLLEETKGGNFCKPGYDGFLMCHWLGYSHQLFNQTLICTLMGRYFVDLIFKVQNQLTLSKRGVTEEKAGEIQSVRETQYIC